MEVDYKKRYWIFGMMEYDRGGGMNDLETNWGGGTWGDAWYIRKSLLN